MTEINKGIVCPECGEYKEIGKNGKRGGLQRYICKKCNHGFTEESREKPSKLPKASWTEDRNTANGSIITAVKPNTIEDAAKLFQVDLEIWTPTRMVTNSWDVTNRNGVSFTNYQVKVWFERKVDDVDLEEMAELFKDKIAKFKPPKLIKYKYRSDGSPLLEIGIYDAHIGSLCWDEETGNTFNSKIAKTRFNSALNDLLHKASAFGYGRIVFVIGHDFFHADNAQNTTFKGTNVETDVRWQKRFKVGEEVAVEAIERCRAIAPVDVVIIRGNHDWTSSYMLGEYLKAWYRGVNGVTIDNSPIARKYYLWKDVMLGFTHGEKEKAVDLFAIMASEQSENWDVAKFKEWHCGHFHHEIAQDYKGVIIRYLKSITGTDKWHFNKGFVGSMKGADAFIWEKGAGLTAHFSSNLVI